MNKKLLTLFGGSILLASPPSAFAGELTGYVAAEYRQFLNDEQFAGQRNGNTPSFIIEPEYYHQSDDRRQNFVAKVFLRYDPNDDDRTHFDVRQADWTYAESDWEFRAGISRVFWGVIESRKLVDTLNQVDQVEDVDEEDRLGQPMIQAGFFNDWGELRFFYLPVFRERTFPGAHGRLRGPTVVDKSEARYQSSAEEFHPNVAARYSHYIGALDLGLAQFHGTSREPTFIIQGTRAIPYYETINQTSLDAQYTADAWLWKLEALFRERKGGDYAAASGGFEYTFFGINEASHDFGLLAEYHYDGRPGDAPQTIFDHDLFIGGRYVFNNVADTEILFGATTDVKTGEQSAVVEVSHRIDAHWKLEADARFFANIEGSAPYNFLEQDDFVQLRMSYNF